MEISINAEQRLFVIPCAGGGYSCFGFDNARDHAQQIAEALRRDDLLPLPSDYGTLFGYDKYQRAVKAWGDSVLRSKTYFDPGTPKAVRTILERYRENGKLVRLFYGDQSTGRDWLEENDVVGRIGRSSGLLKVPLIMSPSEAGGPAILSACVLRIMDAETGKDVFRAENYQVPDLTLAPLDGDTRYKWEVRRDGATHARFDNLYDAAQYVEFLRGTIAATNEQLQDALKGMRRRYA